MRRVLRGRKSGGQGAGIIALLGARFAFNGTGHQFGQTLHCDPWIFAANTPDMQHLKVVHKIRFEMEEPHDLVQWHDFGFEFKYRGLKR